MNGSLQPHPKCVDIKLKRGPAGLGFNIIGGVDQPYLVNDNGVFVTRIKEDGAAALDGRLQEGDKILQINGISLENLNHRDVVDLFRSAGENVELRVVKRAHPSNGPPKPKPKRQPSSPSLGTLTLILGALAILAIAAFYKRRT